MWIDKFKLAVINRDAQKIDELSLEMPDFKNLKEMEEAFYLIQEAQSILLSKKDETLKDMRKLKENINFLKSSTNEKKIKSGFVFNV
jgi:isochorismate hydrolase